MDFIDEIRELAEKALRQKEVLKDNEAATKQALILPFIRLLGYNDEDTSEVWPEYTADAPDKNKKKVDYAILQDGSPTILFECKASDVILNDSHISQLWEYFAPIQEARFGVLTNGIKYQFFSDIKKKNLMDEKPFLELNLLDIRESLVEEVKKFTKANFDVDNILDTASELKYTLEIKNKLTAEFKSPTGDFVKFCIAEMYPGRKTQSVLEQFTGITERAFHQFVNDHVKELLKSASDLAYNSEAATDSEQSDSIQSDDEEGHSQIITTEEELEAFFAVKSILHDTIDLSRIVMRDRISYCGILLDDNDRKPICRLYFNKTPKYLGIFEALKTEIRRADDRTENGVQIDSVNDIYQYADKLKSICLAYDGTNSG